MEAHIRSVTLLAMALAAALEAQPAAAQQAPQFAQSELVRSLLPSVVSITSTVQGGAKGLRRDKRYIPVALSSVSRRQ